MHLQLLRVSLRRPIVLCLVCLVCPIRTRQHRDCRPHETFARNQQQQEATRFKKVVKETRRGWEPREEWSLHVHHEKAEQVETKRKFTLFYKFRWKNFGTTFLTCSAWCFFIRFLAKYIVRIIPTSDFIKTKILNHNLKSPKQYFFIHRPNKMLFLYSNFLFYR